jgi:hypothetical protein
LGPPPTMPPSLGRWAASLQLSGLDAKQAEIARQFLSRAPQLDPRVSDQMAYRIAGDVLTRVAPAPRRVPLHSLPWPPSSPSDTAGNWHDYARSRTDQPHGRRPNLLRGSAAPTRYGR